MGCDLPSRDGDLILRRHYPADPHSIPQIRHDLATAAQARGATDRQLADIGLCVSEAATNALVHGYRGASGEIEVTAAMSGQTLIVLVCDDGVGPREPAERPGLGLGWPLIASTTVWFVVRRRGTGGTEVEMHLAVGPDPRSSGQSPRASDSSATAPPTPRFSTNT